MRREREKAAPLPLVTLEWSLLSQQPGITYFKNFLFMLQEVDLHLEEEFVDALIAYVHALPLDDLHDPKYTATVRDTGQHGPARRTGLSASVATL